MGYYSSLIQRKFRDLVGTRYETVRSEYSDFLASEEEMKVPPVESILLPVDSFVKDFPQNLIEVLSAYEAKINLVYIIDAQVLQLIEEMVGKELITEYRRKKESFGMEVIKDFTVKLEGEGLKVQSSLFSGSKIEDVVRMSHDHDLVAIFRGYGFPVNKVQPLSPDVSQITRRVESSVIIY